MVKASLVGVQIALMLAMVLASFVQIVYLLTYVTDQRKAQDQLACQVVRNEEFRQGLVNRAAAQAAFSNADAAFTQADHVFIEAQRRYLSMVANRPGLWQIHDSSQVDYDQAMAAKLRSIEIKAAALAQIDKARVENPVSTPDNC